MVDGHAFEDQIREFFSRVGFEDVPKWGENREEFYLGGQEIDAFGRYCDLFLVVDAKTKFSQKKKAHGIQKAINVIEGYKKAVIKDIKSKYEKQCGPAMNVVFIFWTNNITLEKKHTDLAKNKKIVLRDSFDLKYYKRALSALESLAVIRNSFLKDIEIQLGEKKIFTESSPIEVDAIRMYIGNKCLYTFTLDVENLLNFGFVYRVETNNLSASYQRLIKNVKIRRINDYLKKGDGYFPNNIIVTTDENLDFDEGKSGSTRLITHGKLKLPNKSSYLEILDGQHRLYGYCKIPNKRRHHMIVTLIENLNKKDKVNLFVNINKKQTPVPAVLLWDLYPIFDPKGRGVISNYVKKLNNSSPLKDLIKLPRLRSKKAYLSFPSICFVTENAIFKKWDNPENIGKITLVFLYEIYRDPYMKRDFVLSTTSKGRKGFLYTNSGMSIQFMLLGRVLQIGGYPTINELKAWESKISTWVTQPLRTFLTNKEQNEIPDDTIGYLRSENASIATRNRTVKEILKIGPLLQSKKIFGNKAK